MEGGAESCGEENYRRNPGKGLEEIKKLNTINSTSPQMYQKFPEHTQFHERQTIIENTRRTLGSLRNGGLEESERVEAIQLLVRRILTYHLTTKETGLSVEGFREFLCELGVLDPERKSLEEKFKE